MQSIIDHRLWVCMQQWHLASLLSLFSWQSCGNAVHGNAIWSYRQLPDYIPTETVLHSACKICDGILPAGAGKARQGKVSSSNADNRSSTESSRHQLSQAKLSFMLTIGLSWGHTLRPSRLHADDEDDNDDGLWHRMIVADSDADMLRAATAVYAVLVCSQMWL